MKSAPTDHTAFQKEILLRQAKEVEDILDRLQTGVIGDRSVTLVPRESHALMMFVMHSRQQNAALKDHVSLLQTIIATLEQQTAKLQNATRDVGTSDDGENHL